MRQLYTLNYLMFKLIMKCTLSFLKLTDHWTKGSTKMYAVVPVLLVYVRKPPFSPSYMYEPKYCDFTLWTNPFDVNLI